VSADCVTRLHSVTAQNTVVWAVQNSSLRAHICGTLVTEAAVLQRPCTVKVLFWCRIEIKLLELKFLCTDIRDLLTVRSKMLGDFTAVVHRDGEENKKAVGRYENDIN